MKHLITLIFFALVSLTTNAQSYRLFNSDNDLPNTLINSIFQDHLGLIWVATEDGLCCYDGVKFVTYKHKEGDDTSLSHNLVRCVIEDKEGNLWIGTHNGLQYFDRNKQRFSPLATDDKGKLLMGNVNKIIQLSNGEIWVSGNDLYKATINGDKLEAKIIDYPGPHHFIQDIMEDAEGNIWSMHLHDGIYVYRSRDKVVKHYFGGIDGVSYMRIGTDERGNVFASAHGMGVMQFNKALDKFEIIPGTENLLAISLDFNGHGDMYIGTDGMGFYSYNIGKKELVYQLMENKFFNFRRSKIHAMLMDSDGDVWLGIYQKGVMLIKNKSNLFNTIGHRTFEKNIIGSEAVTSIAEDILGRMWIATDNDGVYAIGSDGDNVQHFSYSQNPSMPKIILGIVSDKKGRVWTASYTDGLGYLTSAGQYVKYPLYSKSSKIAVSSAMATYLDYEGKLWTVTLGNNLYCVDTNTDQLIEMYSETPEINAWQCSVYRAKNGKLYVGTYDGLYVVTVQKGKLAVESHVLGGIIINSITEDATGNIWMATPVGLSMLDTKTKKITTLTTANGLPTNTVYSVRCDMLGYVWAATSGGLAEFNKSMNHVTNFYASDGLQGNEFSRNAAFTDSKGRVWFGGSNGVTYFDTKEMSVPESNWDVRVTDFYVNNNPVNTTTESGFWNVIDTNVLEAKEFHLSNDDNSFTIEFATKQLNSPDGLIYEYSVDGAEPIVLPAGTNRISFSNLSSGTYHIKIGVHDNPEANPCEITVKVHTTIFNHWIAWILYLLILAVLVYKAVQYLQKWFKTKNELRRHKHQEEINESRLQMFTNISHDIRTPMTLIISPLERLMKNDSDETKRHNSYETMYRNANRILSLVNQLMDVRKLENGKLELSLSQQDIIPIINNVCEAFVEKAVERNITFTYIHDGIDRIYANVDLQHFDKIFANLISNAMKFAPDNGIVTVCVNRLPDSKVQIRVSDNGIGIPDSDKVHIFERFYQVKKEKSSFTVGNASDARLQATGGTGVGLHLAQAIVQMHNGTIHVEDNEEGPGCRFVVVLPYVEAPIAMQPEAQNVEIEVQDVEENPEVETQDTAELETAVTEGKSETDSATASVAALETQPEKKPKAARRPQVQTNYHVLIVDDDQDIAKYIQQELSDRYHCSVCKNGKEALEYVLKNPTHLVISDVLMPEMSGIELTKRMKANVNINHIPIVLVTALNDTQSNVEGLNVGAAAYLTKPFDVTLLKTTVDNIIKSRQRLKNVYEGKQTVERRIPKTELQTPDERLMKRVMKIVEQHIFDHNLSVELLASEVGISRVHLNRKLKELTNQTTTDFIKNIRLKRAAELLSQKKHSIAEVADMVGFQNANNFSTAFRKLYGMSPREYMSKNQE